LSILLDSFIVEASIYRTEADASPMGNGLAEETIQGRGVNAPQLSKTAKLLLSAGLLANAGYATKGKRASREEMTKVVKRCRSKN
jgi:hypothetical protein